MTMTLICYAYLEDIPRTCCPKVGQARDLTRDHLTVFNKRTPDAIAHPYQGSTETRTKSQKRAENAFTPVSKNEASDNDPTVSFE